MKNIDKNPFRLLGIYGNSTLREQIAQLSKIRAYAKVGQTLELPLRMDKWLPEMTIDEELLREIASFLERPEDRKRYAMLWFERLNGKDDTFVEFFAEKKLSKAMECLGERTDHAALQNQMMASLIQKQWDKAFHFAEAIYEDSENIRLFLQLITEDSEVEIEDVFFHYCNSDIWKQETKELICEQYNEQFDACYENAKRVDDSDMKGLKSALMEFVGKADLLLKLKDVMGGESLIYEEQVKQFVKEMNACAKRYSECPGMDSKIITLAYYKAKLLNGVELFTTSGDNSNHREGLGKGCAYLFWISVILYWIFLLGRCFSEDFWKGTKSPPRLHYQYTPKDYNKYRTLPGYNDSLTRKAIEEFSKQKVKKFEEIEVKPIEISPTNEQIQKMKELDSKHEDLLKKMNEIEMNAKDIHQNIENNIPDSKEPQIKIEETVVDTTRR